MVRMKIKIDHSTLRRNHQKLFFPNSISSSSITSYNESLTRKIEEAINLMNLDDDLLNIYNQLEHIIKTTAKNELMKPKTKQIDKLSLETKALINQREILTHKMNPTENDKEELRNIRKTIKNKAKDDVQKYNETKIKEILKNTKSIKKTKNFINSEKEWIVSLKQRNNNMTKRKDINETATSFFESLFKSTKDIAFDTDSDISFDSSENDTIFLLNETDVSSAIDSLKAEKSAGCDEIEAEMLKYGKDSLTPILTKIFNAILTTQLIPKQWQQSKIILLHKKGDKDNINNYRPISLISTIYKLFSKTVYNRTKEALNDKQPREQAGFREGFSTTDHLQTINQLIEKHNEYKKPLYLCFIDFTKAFDTVEHSSIWTALSNQNIHPTLIKTFRNIYKNNTAKVKTDKLGREFHLKRGVRQGDPMSPPLFSAVLEDIFERLKWRNRYGIQVWGEYLNNLRFADDVVLLSNSPTQIQTMLNQLSAACKKDGLCLNLTKTKIMTNHIKEDIFLEDDKIDYVEDYVYLGQIKSFEKQEDKEVNRRITNGWKQYWSLNEILKSNISSDTRKYVIDSTILPVLTYGLQTIGLTSNQQEKLRICQVKIERKLLNIRQVQRICNEEIRRRTNIVDVIQRTKQLKWSWAGHISRTEDQRWTKIITKWTLFDERRPRGRPKKRWVDDLNEYNNNWYNDAKNRAIWTTMGEAYAG